MPTMVKKEKMMKTNMMFALIIAWSIISTTLLVYQHHRNLELQHELSSSSSLSTSSSSSSDASFLMKEQQQQQMKQNGQELGERLKKQMQRNRQKRIKNKRNAQQGETRQEFSSEMTQPQQQQQQQQNHITIIENSITSYNKFPFTRSLNTFTNSENFYIYIVQSSSTVSLEERTISSSLKWSEVRWKDLVTNWGRTTTFSDLIQLSTPLHRPPEEEEEEGNPTNNNTMTQHQSSSHKQSKLVIHCLPKTASTTLRMACRENLRKNCEFAKNIEPPRNDPYGYRDVNKFFQAVDKCPNVHHYCVQGGDAQMQILNYDGGDNDNEVENDGNHEDGKDGSSAAAATTTAEEDANSETVDAGPHHFVHLVPFRNFDDWAASALKQIYVIDKQCQDIDNLLEHCLGYRELFMELYPKSVLAMLTGMALSATMNHQGDNDGVASVGRGHHHHIVLYNYEETDAVATDISNFFGIPPMPKTDGQAKKDRSEGTCPKETLERFHECHDKALMTMDSIMDLEGERKRRFKEMVKARRIRPAYKYQEKPVTNIKKAGTGDTEEEQ